jgi:hypothetical protein
LIGSSLTGGLLLNSDTAAGSDFAVGDGTDPDPTPTTTPTPDPTPTPSPDPTPDPTPSPDPTPGENPNSGGRFDERYSGTISPGQGFVDVVFELRRSLIDAQMTQNHGNQPLTFELYDADGNLIATAANRKIYLNGLTQGTYRYRISGTVTRAVDFTVMSGQGQ